MYTHRFLLPALGERWKFRRIIKQTVLWETVWTFAVAPFVIGPSPLTFVSPHVRLKDFSRLFDGRICTPHRDPGQPTVRDYEGRLRPECRPS